jgi:DNA polymerase (family 10)
VKGKPVTVHNTEIAELFERLADLLEIEDANPFRVRAYRNAARVVRSHGRSMADLIREGADLSELPGIGKDIAGKIQTIVETGKLPLLQEVEARTPGALADMMRIPGLGPKRVKTLYKSLRIRTIEDLSRALRKGKIRTLPGFGPKTEATIRKRLEAGAGREQRMKRADSELIANALVAWLQQSKGVKDIAVAGSYRRCKETVGDLDILATATRDSDVMQRFAAYDEVAEIVSQGSTRSTVRLRSGLQVDLRVVPAASYGAALQYFTGSKAHNIEIRARAAKKGLKINEYGVFRGDERIAGKTEAEVYKQVGLPVIPPELREGRGEIEAGRKGKLPRLIERGDLKGDLHVHTDASDGHNTIEQMARAAQERGYEYLAICDHSRHVTIAHGLDRKRMLAQIKEIDRLNGKLDGIVILKSSECDILDNGKLDLPDDVLRELDLTVCAVHYKFHLPRKQQTERILRAMDSRYFNILAHPTGRLINERDPYDIDLERLMEAAVERGCYMEVNAYPVRLDLTDDACRAAKDLGLKLAISTDAHRTSDLDFIRFGVDQARRGWIEKKDVLNTRSLRELRKLLQRN